MLRVICRIGSRFVLAAVLLPFGVAPVRAAPELVGVHFRPDEPFPEFDRFWVRGMAEGAEGDVQVRRSAGPLRLGASVHLFFRNAGAKPLAVDDVYLEGLSLRRAIAFSDQRKNRKPASIVFSDLSPQEKQKLVAAGDPIWWRVDPPLISPGSFGEVTIRLRSVAQTKSLTCELRCGDRALAATAEVCKVAPRIEGAVFSPDLRTLSLYLKHPNGDKRSVKRILLDGNNVMGAARFATDPRVDVAPAEIRLPQAVATGSFHCVQAVWDDGSTAMAGIRARHDEFAYGVWGGRPGKEDDIAAAEGYVRDLKAHNVNVQMPQVGSAALSSFFKTPAGRRFCEEEGMRFVIGEIEKWGVRQPFALFIHDEPDAGDAHIRGLPAGREVGSLAQWAIERSYGWRQQASAIPQALNVDLTYKPHNWYVYGQLPDILMADPYYQPRLRTAYWDNPKDRPLYTRATFVYAISRIIQSAAAPKPTHAILYANRYIDRKTGREFRGPTPVEKRIEMYYALAAGAKGISYWWMTPGKPAYGMGGAHTESRRLWREVGLLGAEARTAGPLLVRGCAADVPAKAPKDVFVRGLLVGLDTMVVIVVNEQHVNDDKGTTVTPVADLAVEMTLPAWLKPADVFEIDARGPRKAEFRIEEGQIALPLGMLEATRMVVVTADASLRERLAVLHRDAFAANVEKLLAEGQ